MAESRSTGSTKFMISVKVIFFFCAFLFYIFACTFAIPIAYSVYLLINKFNPRNQKFVSIVGKLWFLTTQSLLAIIIGCNVHVVYNPKLLTMAHKKSICISNHTTYIDWLVIWGALFELGRSNLIFVAKEGIRSIFFLSLGIKMLSFILLSRKIEKDRSKIQDACKHLKDKSEYTLVLFPEGTFITTKTKENDISFLKEQKERRKNQDPDKPCTLPENITDVSKKVIFPRVKGFSLLLEELKTQVSHFTNCTLYVRSPNPSIYPSEYYTLKRIFSGECPKLSFLLIFDYLPISPEAKKDPKAWIYKIFNEKDKSLLKLDQLSDEQISNYHIHEKSIQKKYNSLRLHPNIPALIFIFLGASSFAVLFFYAIYHGLYKLIHLLV